MSESSSSTPTTQLAQEIAYELYNRLFLDMGIDELPECAEIIDKSGNLPARLESHQRLLEACRATMRMCQSFPGEVEVAVKRAEEITNGK